MMLATIRRVTARMRALFSGADRDVDFAQELQSHLEMLTEDNIARGMEPIEARRQAAIRVGAASSLRMQHRDTRAFPALESLFQDLHFAARLMLKDRWFTAAAITAIALGIGANTVGFTIVNSAFFSGFGLERADELRIISWRPDRGRRVPSSYMDLQDWRSQSHSFSGIAAYGFGAINISDDASAPEQTQGARVTANHFSVLRQRPMLGRDFVNADEGAGADPVVIIGHELWSRRFAADPHVVGRTLRVNGVPSTIVGVMADGARFPDDSELWVPVGANAVQMPRHIRAFGVVARLKDGVSDVEASADIDTIAKRIIANEPEETRGVIGGQIETLTERFVGGMARPMFITVMGAVSFVLLIACANVANLLLSRAIYRGREVAVRYSLGATRGRIVRQLLIESIALSTLGGIVGLALAVEGVQAFEAAVQMAQPPYWLHFSIDYRVVAYVAGTCVATGILFGLAPAMHLSRDSQHDALKESGRGTAGNRRAGRFGNGLVVAELALTVILLCGAGLMVRSFITLYTLDPGFNVDGLLRMRLQLPPAKYPGPDARLRFFEQLQPRVDAIAGVTASAVATSVPPSADEMWRIEVDNRPSIEGDRRPLVATVTISPTYFDLLGVAVRRGRPLNTSDGQIGAENVVISERMAERVFHDEDPIGRRIRFVPREDEPEAPPQPWRTIVGVSAPFLQGAADEAFRSAVVYIPLRQNPPRTASLLIRSALPPTEVMTAVRQVVQSIDIDQPVFSIETVAHAIDNERLFHRLFSVVFGVLAAIALALSAIGVYGVMAYAVTQRTQEIGIRMAVGAQRTHVSWMFLRRCLIQLAAALVIGLPGAIALGQVVRFNLVEISPTDPVTIVTITLLLIGVAFASCLVPVRRASKVDPVIALRSE